MRTLIRLLLANWTTVPGHRLTEAERMWLERVADLRTTHRMIQTEKDRFMQTVADESEVVRVRTHATASRVVQLKRIG